ncbi:DUF6379 domain-containing protein [Klebsiella oxytoca]|uniref:C-glycoside deglycosidase beta subunit domain-containing protein n=1 Tax=Klebsiella oxytoca TaxID=571 RepID=UPI003570C937
MFDNYLIRPGSLKNEKVNGDVIGFSLAVRHANYRGCYVSLHNGYYLSIDGIEYPNSVQTFEINGKKPRSYEELSLAVYEHWDYGDDGILHVALPGGLKPGKHTVLFQQSVLAAYGYLPTDETWVKNPPVPGNGAGSDKTPHVVKFEMIVE